MKLTGQAEKDFEKWYESLEDFYHLELMPDNMVYGVLVDWFDSVGIHVNTNYECYEDNCYYYVDGVATDYFILNDNETTRPEARTAAIDKANEIYNEVNG